jgi:hypothetical protein
VNEGKLQAFEEHDRFIILMVEWCGSQLSKARACIVRPRIA